MKRLDERGAGPRSGYIAPCSQCGLRVVHADSTNEPFHMHRWSKKCRELAAKREKEKNR